jgi:hypothetical protein
MVYASLRSRNRISTDEKQARGLILSGKLGSHEETFDILLNKSKCDKLVSRRIYKSLIPRLMVTVPNTQDHRPLTADEIKRLLNGQIHFFIHTRDDFTINALRSE